MCNMYLLHSLKLYAQPPPCRYLLHSSSLYARSCAALMLPLCARTVLHNVFDCRAGGLRHSLRTSSCQWSASYLGRSEPYTPGCSQRAGCGGTTALRRPLRPCVCVCRWVHTSACSGLSCAPARWWSTQHSAVQQLWPSASTQTPPLADAVHVPSFKITARWHR
jgi:hypothetical protein